MNSHPRCRGVFCAAQPSHRGNVGAPLRSPSADVARMLAHYERRGVPRVHIINHGIRSVVNRGMHRKQYGKLMLRELKQLLKLERQRKRAATWTR